MDSVLTLVINLERSKDRLRRIGAALDLQGIGWERLAAVDGRALDQATVDSSLDVERYCRQHGMTPLPGELGCYLSHLEAFKRLMDSPFQFGLILEDDVMPQPALAEIVRTLTGMPERWDMVKLSAVHSGTPIPTQPLGGPHHLAVMLSRCTGSSAYLVNRRAAKAYLAGLLPMSLPYDHEFDKGWKYGLKIRRVVPEVALHDMGAASTISQAATTPSRKFRWHKRLAAHRYRLGNELRRLSHGLMQVCKEKLRI